LSRHLEVILSGWAAGVLSTASYQTQKASGKIRRLLDESQRPLRGRLPSGVSAPPSARPPWWGRPGWLGESEQPL